MPFVLPFGFVNTIDTPTKVNQHKVGDDMKHWMAIETMSSYIDSKVISPCNQGPILY